MTEAELREFLQWFKTETEKRWATWEPTLKVGIYESEPRSADRDWQGGTRWQPLAEPEIDRIERRWMIQFPWDYRIFLSEVGVPDRPALIASWIDGERIECKEGHHFMNWLADDLEVAYRLNWPTMGLIGDSQKPWWWDDSWGIWDKDPEQDFEMAPWEIAAKVMTVTRAAPQLIPLFGHRFLLPRPERPSLGLSVMGSDIIVWGHDLRQALLSTVLPLPEYPKNMTFPKYEELKVQEIPFWGRIIG